MVLAGVLKTALITQSGFHMFAQIADASLKAQGKNIDGMDLLIQKSEEMAPFAKEHMKTGFHIVHAHALINMWAATSTSIDETIAACLLHDDAAATAGYDLLGTKLTKRGPIGEEEAIFMASKISRAALKTKVAEQGYVELFGALDIHIRTDRRDFSGLEECRCVRNCLVHKNGVLDQYCATRVPSLAPLVGTDVVIDLSRGLRYCDAMNHFIVEFADAVAHSRYLN